MYDDIGKSRTGYLELDSMKYVDVIDFLLCVFIDFF